MLKNRNFEWMLTYREPDLPFDIIKDVYWLYMYMKIRGQGTQDDVLRLVELYDESFTGTVSTRIGLFSLDFNVWFHHRYAVTKFISEVMEEHYRDEMRREDAQLQARVARELAERRDEQFGIDWAALRREFELAQAELDADGATDPVRNTPFYEVTNGFRHMGTPKAVHLKAKGKLIKSFDVTWECVPQSVNGRFAGVIDAHTHVDVYDRFQNMWCAVLTTDVDPERLPNGEPMPLVYADHVGLIDPVNSLRGMIHGLREVLRAEELCVTSGYWDLRGKLPAEQLELLRNKRLSRSASAPAAPAKRSRRLKAPDISKVQKALGVVDDNCGNDLDCDIF